VLSIIDSKGIQFLIELMIFKVEYITWDERTVGIFTNTERGGESVLSTFYHF
jgi:hypothetical protein